MTERRKFMRFNALIDVFYHALGNPAAKYRSCMRDLSKEGMRISSEKKLDEGSELELELKIPGDNIPIFANAEVAWSERFDENRYESGVRITKIERFDRAKLMDYVYQEWLSAKRFNKEI